MLRDVLTNEISLALSAVSLSDRSGVARIAGADLKVSAKELLKSVFAVLNSNSWEDLSEQEVRQLCGIRQQLLSLSMESCNKFLSDNLRRLGESLVNDPSFVAVGEALLQAVVKAKLENWQGAQHALEVYWGTSGSFGEQIGKTLRGLSQTKTLAPMVVAMAGAGLVGRGAKLFGTHLFRSTRLMSKGGELAVHAAASASGLLAEAAVFPGMHAGGALLVNQPVHLENYLGQAWDGLKLMSSLRFAGAAARITRQGIHGLKLAKSAGGMTLPVASRFLSLTSLTQFALPAAYELGTLTLLNHHNHSQQTLAANFAGALGLSLEFRLAGAALQSLAPGITAANHVLELKSLETLKTGGLRLANSFSQKVRDLFGAPDTGFGLRTGPRKALAELGGMVPELGQRSEIKSLQRELLEARLQSRTPGAMGGPEGPERFEVSQAVQEGMEIPETFYLDLQKEMEGKGEIPKEEVRQRSPLTDKHWSEFKEIVDSVLKQELTEHEGVYGLIAVLFKNLYQGLLRPFHEQIGKIVSEPEDTFRDPNLLVGAVSDSALEAMDSIRRVSVLVKTYYSDAVFSYGEGLGALNFFYNLLLTGGQTSHTPLLLGKVIFEDVIFHFPNPLDYIEFLFNQGQRIPFSYERVKLKYWVDYRLGSDPEGRKKFSQGRFLTVSPFYQAPIHYYLKKGNTITESIAYGLDPMLMVYHDLSHGTGFFQFSVRQAKAQQIIVDTYRRVAMKLEDPELLARLLAVAYDFGGMNEDYLSENSFEPSYDSLFMRSILLAEEVGKKEMFVTELIGLLSEADSGSGEGEIRSEIRRYLDKSIDRLGL